MVFRVLLFVRVYVDLVRGLGCTEMIGMLWLVMVNCILLILIVFLVGGVLGVGVGMMIKMVYFFLLVFIGFGGLVGMSIGFVFYVFCVWGWISVVSVVVVGFVSFVVVFYWVEYCYVFILVVGFVVVLDGNVVGMVFLLDEDVMEVVDVFFMDVVGEFGFVGFFKLRVRVGV